MAFKILALDLDGTLLTSDKRVSARTRDALAALADAGCQIALCTGRGLRELEDLPCELPFVRFGILASGAHLVDLWEGVTLEAHPIPYETVRQIMGARVETRCMPHLVSEDLSVAQARDVRDMGRFHMDAYRPMYERVCEQVEDVDAWLVHHPNEVLKLNLYCEIGEVRARIRGRIERLRAAVTLADAEATSLECSRVGVDKGQGLRALASLLGTDLAHCVFIGDSGNDRAALEACGMPVAMGNATPEVRSLARLVVADNDHDGVAQAASLLFRDR